MNTFHPRICNVCWGDLRLKWWAYLSQFIDRQEAQDGH